MNKINRRFIQDYNGFLLGLIIFIAFLFLLPSGMMPEKAQHMAAIALLMAIWWITEAIPIPVTALLPILLYPLLKIMKTPDVTVNYGHHLIFLFLGGFIIALTIERWNLHKRMALVIINRIGSNQRFIILGFMIATAFLSMWISNTATTMMMIPIALAVISQIGNPDNEQKFIKGRNNFALALMLAIAYSASIGGISTLIGTPPNVVFVGIYNSSFPNAPEISFLQWMLFALPFSLVFLPLAWFYLVFIAAPVQSSSPKNDLFQKELQKLGPMSRPEKYTLSVFLITALLWIFRSDIDLGSFQIRGWASLLGLKGYVHDSTVAMAMAILTFIIPAQTKEHGKRQFLMNWTTATKIPWGILLLFGGGFALAHGFQESGLTQWLGQQLNAVRFLPLLFIIIIICTITTFTTEFASNTAMASTLLPIIAGLSIALHLNPLILMIPATISSSTAFMLPVATPPNAIVFGSGYIKIRDMVKIGIIMNLLGLALITFFLYTTAPSIFNFDWNILPSWLD
jgi:sodium-dependent dicarboxylate transporter 2/3/5